MSLKEEIDKSIKEAMLQKKKDELQALRSIKSLILLAQTKEGAGDEISEEEEMAILKKAAKQRRDSIAVYKEQGRDDLASEEELELAVIERFLPELMGEAEVRALVQAVIDELGASGMGDMGKVMPAVIKKAAGGADNQMISKIVREILAG